MIQDMNTLFSLGGKKAKWEDMTMNVVHELMIKLCDYYISILSNFWAWGTLYIYIINNISVVHYVPSHECKKFLCTYFNHVWEMAFVCKEKYFSLAILLSVYIVHKSKTSRKLYPFVKLWMYIPLLDVNYSLICTCNAIVQVHFDFIPSLLCNIISDFLNKKDMDNILHLR